MPERIPKNSHLIFGVLVTISSVIATFVSVSIKTSPVLLTGAFLLLSILGGMVIAVRFTPLCIAWIADTIVNLIKKRRSNND